MAGSRRGPGWAGLALGLLALAAPAAAQAAIAERPWPPAGGEGVLFAHLGEEHIDDPDGPRIFPRVVEQTARYRPSMVLTSSDKSSNGTAENLRAWRAVMEGYDRAGIPWFPAVGNHDREALPGTPEALFGVAPLGNGAPYRSVFADRPYPFGDAAPYADPQLAGQARPPGDPSGASTHYAVDYGPARWIVIDNGCFGILNCDPLQSPAFPDAEGNTGQYEFLRRRAREAKARGMKVFVVMHMPTQDPRPGHTQPTPGPHTMGEGTNPENALFESEAAQLAIDGVFLGHVKGMWTYAARGVPYFTDGGAGGEVYVGDGEQVGTDSGYWHGYRLVRVLPGGRVVTDAVPVFAPDGITVRAPERVARGSVARLTATGRQPATEGIRVDELALRDPDRSAPNFANLPSPARIWTTETPVVAEPVRARTDDQRSDPATQNESGAFRAACPGRATVSITSGFETSAASFVVASRSGRLVRSISRRARFVTAGADTQLAAVRLAQPAQVLARVTRGQRTVATLGHRCRGRAPLAIRWDGEDDDGRPVAPGDYTLEVRVRSDRRPVVRRLAVRVR